MSICRILANLSASDWAAWAQAIGSIGAIIAAFLVGKPTGESRNRSRCGSSLFARDR
jgi:uncharacterized membrane protein YdjX (TVP38/TMEM64 family)